MRERSFTSLGAAAVAIVTDAALTLNALRDGLEASARMLEATARAEIGVLQPAVGPFNAWAPLAQSTVDAKGHDRPLEDTREMVDSFQHETDRLKLEAIAGATDEKMIWHELGTSKMPPRPVWGPAAYRCQDAIARLIGAAAVCGLLGDVNGFAASADQMAELTGSGYRYQIGP